eukprot:COSAG06_NODE_6291_length_2995_cov_95.512605_1_plen_61_part_00
MLVLALMVRVVVLIGFLLRESGRIVAVHCCAVLPASACLASATTATAALSPCSTISISLL